MGKFALTDLVMTADLAYTKTFQFSLNDVPVDWTDYEVHLQMVTRVGGSLLIELTAFLEVDPDDPTRLVLDVPADFTRHLFPEGRWDILAIGDTSFRTPRPAGRVLVLQGATQRA